MITTVASREAAALLAKGGLEVVDVRTAREWATGHLPGARHVPLDELRADPAGTLPHDGVLFVCEKGTRSRVAAGIAERQGLSEVYTLEGGTRGWAQAGLPLEGVEAAAKSAPVVETRATKSAPVDTRPVRSAPAEATRARVEAKVESVELGLDAIIGANVRELRTRRGMSLDALAKQAGVSRAQLGQMELGKSVPSINVVWRLAGALDVPFANLVASTPRVGTTVLRRSKAKQLVSAEGRFGSRALFPPSEKGNVEFYELWLAGHSREDAEAHAPGTRENLVVTVGRLDLEVGDAKYQLEAGDAIVFTADVPHAYINPASDECWMCLVMTYAATST